VKKQENPEFHVDLMFPSAYLRAADFDGKQVTLTITEVLRDSLRLATGGNTEKYILRFKETEKMLVLNKTNAKLIAKHLHEPKAINWPGARIVLGPDRCDAFGETVDCIRVKGGSSDGA